MVYNYVYSSGAVSLVATATKTANYTAAVNDLVIVDGTSSSPVITLPTAPPDLSTVAVKRWDATYTSSQTPTVAPGGSDAFLGGSTTPASLQLQGQVFIFQYTAPAAQWIVRSTDEPLSGLDSRYRSTVVEYTTTQTGVTVPAGVTGVWIESLIGPGGGGASGRRGAAGTVRCGGGGGASGAMITNYFIPAALLGSTFTLTLPAGGTGGAAVTADNTDGNPGTAPATASLASGSLLVATWPGSASAGGTNASGTGGGASQASVNGATGGSASTSGGVGGTGGLSFNGGATGAGAGGGITSGNSPSNGGSGIFQTLNYGAVLPSAGVVGGALPQAGNAAQAGIGGMGAGGGAASITGAAQAGATATGYGAGGGGGGASLNGNNSGNGGNGGSAYCRLRWEYI